LSLNSLLLAPFLHPNVAARFYVVWNTDTRSLDTHNVDAAKRRTQEGGRRRRPTDAVVRLQLLGTPDMGMNLWGESPL